MPGSERVSGGAVPHGLVEEVAARHDAAVVALRRDLHAHPELSRAEVRTTRVLREHLEAAGLEPQVLPGGSGLLCDVGAASGRTVALRGDIDALPISDEKPVSYRSTSVGVSHACGHDVHASCVVGAGLVLADLAAAGRLPGRVRLVLQPAEEIIPGGALDVVAAGGLDGVDEIYALHCDPRAPVGTVGLRAGAITASADRVFVRLTGRGGHTARPHLTGDLVHALGTVVTDLPTALSRRVDPRAGLSVVWGRVAAGTAANAIPRSGEAEGTVRCLQADAWEEAPALVETLVAELVAPYGVAAEVRYLRGVPPVSNTPAAADLMVAAAHAVLGPGGVRDTEQSLGAEDFAWYLEKVPGALARLGTARPGEEGALDLHQGDFDVDERAIGAGMRLLSTTAMLAVS